MSLKILTYPNKNLRKPTVAVTVFDETLQLLSQQMLAAMYEVKGWGLAANQVGQSTRLFVMINFMLKTASF